MLHRGSPIALLLPMALFLCACPGKGSGGLDEGAADAAATALVPASSTVAPGGRGRGACPANEVTVLVPPGRPACAMECRSNAGCPPGAACHGEGYLLTDGKPTAPIRYCVGVLRGEVHDAGGPARPAPADAGKPEPEPRRLDVKKIGGECPAGYKACGAVCRMGCAHVADCGEPTARCVNGFCIGPGAEPCAN